MRKNKTCLLLCAIALVTSVISFNCKKKNNNGCGIDGGFHTATSFHFYIARDFGCGTITMHFFREDGSEIPYDPYLNVISIYDRVPPTATACVANDDNYYKRAQVSVAEGYTYTYEASCSGKSWRGEVTAACNAEECKLIELK